MTLIILNPVEYFILFICAGLGVAFDVSDRIGKIQTANPKLSLSFLWFAFLKQDWNTLVKSALAVIAAMLLLRVGVRLLAANKYTAAIIFLFQIKEVVFIAVGYYGQVWAYRGLGTLNAWVEKFVDDQDPAKAKSI